MHVTPPRPVPLIEELTPGYRACFRTNTRWPLEPLHSRLVPWTPIHTKSLRLFPQAPSFHKTAVEPSSVNFTSCLFWCNPPPPCPIFNSVAPSLQASLTTFQTRRYVIFLFPGVLVRLYSVTFDFAFYRPFSPLSCFSPSVHVTVSGQVRGYALSPGVFLTFLFQRLFFSPLADFPPPLHCLLDGFPFSEAPLLQIWW